jgi:hypothetical protein
MASYTINFVVSGDSITNDDPTEDVNAGDTISFSTNQTVYVKFDAGQWPFTETEPSNRTITVSNSAGPYTVADDDNAIDAYEVSLTLGGAAKATGTVDIDPDR